MNKTYEKQHYSNLITSNIKVHLIRVLLRQDMNNQIWKTISSELSVKPDYNKEWITKELDLDDDEITVTITSKKGKKIEFSKKLKIYMPTEEELNEWDKTHDKEFVSRMICPPGDEVGGNSGRQKMTEKRFEINNLVKKGNMSFWDNENKLILNASHTLDLLNKLTDENEQLTSVNQELRNELKFDEEMYKTFKEIIDEADDLITSHLSKHYQRQWKNFCKHRGVLDD